MIVDLRYSKEGEHHDDALDDTEETKELFEVIRHKDYV